MEKDQLDSLATVAVGSEKIPPPPHSHYAPSEMYSSSESPPAYSRPGGKSTAVQIAKIIATTLIAISVIIGSFILGAAWLQARNSCSPEAVSGLQHQPEELFKRIQPEALVQEPIIEAKESLQSIAEPAATKQPLKEIKKAATEAEESSKSDNENAAADSENDDDYDDPEFPPVHIKLPLRLDLDDLAGTLMQHARSLVSCVVERRKDDGGEDPAENGNTERSRLAGERVTILCESSDPRGQKPQEQDILTPIIMPLGPLHVPMRGPEQEYHRYHVQNQFPVPEVQRPPFINLQNINQIEQGMQIRPIAQILKNRMPISMNQQSMEIPIEVRQIPIEIIRGMRPPMNQEPAPQISIFAPEAQQAPAYGHQEQNTQGMMPPPPPPASQVMPAAGQNEGRLISPLIVRHQVEQKSSESQESSEKPLFPFPGLPLEIRRIFQQVPMEIKNIIQHITGEDRQIGVPEGARREDVQDFKRFPENPRPVSLEPFMFPIEVRGHMEPASMENQRPETFEAHVEQVKPFANGENHEDKAEDEEKKFPVPPIVKNLIQRVIGEGRDFPLSSFMPIRSYDTLAVPMEVSARVMSDQEHHEDKEETPEQHAPPQQPSAQVMQVQQDEQEEANRPHYVQPRSVRSVPDVGSHARDKRDRR